jgi:hypothetical protein
MQLCDCDCLSNGSIFWWLDIFVFLEKRNAWIVTAVKTLFYIFVENVHSEVIVCVLSIQSIFRKRYGFGDKGSREEHILQMFHNKHSEKVWM